MRKRYLVALVAVGVLLAATTVALAAATTQSKLTESFKTNKHGKPTSVTFSLVNTPPTGQQLPAKSTHDLNVLPAGTGYNPAGPYCSVAALQAAVAQSGNTNPGSACPAASQVGSGSSNVGAQLTPGGPPITENATVTAYAGGPNQLLLLAVGTVPIPQNILLVGTVTHNSSGVKVDVPIQDIFPYVGGPNVKIVTFKVTIGKGKLLTTPKTCPKSGKWSFSNTAGFSDGSSTSRTTQKC